MEQAGAKGSRGRGSEPPGELPPRDEPAGRGLGGEPAGRVLDGVLLVDKPAGPTSHDVVARIRRSLPRGAKVGHGGTLDPFATGLLLVLVGRATRIQRFLLELPKSYETVVRLGWTSSTGDPEGELRHTGAVPRDPPALPTGMVRQRPPAHSAVKVGGRRAYALARAGEAVAVPEREVRVDRFEQLWRDGDRAAFAIDCSSGTYVRSLVADLGDAYCLELRRTAIGPFRVEDADEQRPVTLADALRAAMPAVALDEEAAWRAGHGQAIELEQAPPAGPHALLLDPAGEPVAVAEVHDGGRLTPRVGFRA